MKQNKHLNLKPVYLNKHVHLKTVYLYKQLSWTSYANDNDIASLKIKKFNSWLVSELFDIQFWFDEI